MHTLQIYITHEGLVLEKRVGKHIYGLLFPPLFLNDTSPSLVIYIVLCAKAGEYLVYCKSPFSAVTFFSRCGDLSQIVD